MGMLSDAEKAFTQSKRNTGKQLSQADKDFTATKKQILGFCLLLVDFDKRRVC